MKTKFRAIFALLLCLSLCLILVPGASAEGEAPVSVRFYSEKGYDLVGLTVTDADGNAIAPADTGDGYVYLLAPGAYTYAYHDDRDIFADIAETDFAVGAQAQEIPLTLASFLQDNYYSGIILNPIYPGEDVESRLLAAMPSREEFVDALVDRRLAEAESGTEAFVLSDTDVFGAGDESSVAADELKAAMLQRRETGTITFTSNTRWDNEDWDNSFYHALLQALRHTGDHREGDTLKETLASAGYDGTGSSTGGMWTYTLSYTLIYRTTAQQEQATENAVENLVRSLNLSGKTDYEKVSAIHEWLYQNVNYDFNNTLPELRYTDYSALINKLAVCQGFATAYYRLCLAAGVDARYVSSTVFNHGWNIVQVGGKYYESDATWDSNTREKNYARPLPNFLLRGSDWWLANHTDPDDETYSTIGDEFDHNSYTLIDPSYSLNIWTLQEQYAEYDLYDLSVSDYDPATAGIAVDAANFPDPVFRAYVSANCDTDGDGYLGDAEIAAVTTLNVYYIDQSSSAAAAAVQDTAAFDGAAISGAFAFRDVSSYSAATAPSVYVPLSAPLTSLKGIEYFTALQTLICCGNELTELDVSRNTALEMLYCGIMDQNGVVYGNHLTTLDLSKNKALRFLYCTHNQISSLDVSGNSELEILYCYNNDMTHLNIAGCAKLTELSCGNNKLTSLDIGSNTALTKLLCYNNQLNSLNARNHPSLAFLQCAANPLLGALDLSGCASLTNLHCQNCSLSALNVSGCTALTQVACANNSLTVLDFSTCTSLYDLGCQNNRLVTLNVSGCGNLGGLGCGGNRLQSLDLRSCVNLCGLICSDNPLTSVDISNCPNLVYVTNAAAPTIDGGVVSYARNSCKLTCDENVEVLITNLLTLPTDLTVIEDEALSGGAFTYVRVPDRIASIGWHAFADCPNLAFIYIPAGISDIDPDAFDGSTGVTIAGAEGSPAQTYALDHSFSFIAVE